MSTTTITLTPAQEAFRKKMLNVWLFRTFAFFKVPMGWLSGMRLAELTTERAVATQPFKWFNMNPFKSTYFAVQSMAAELSTAAIGLLAIEGNNPSIATIIIDMKAEFPKKATGRVTFTCEDGQKIFEAVERAKSAGEASTTTAKTVGTMADGTVVSVFEFTWSFKQRSR